jgi:hypothetical protein
MKLTSLSKSIRVIHSATMFSAIVATATLSSGLPAIAAPSADFVGGKTSVTLSSDFVNALTTLKVSTIVELTDYAITNLDGKPVLTGLVKANDSLVGRIPLFNLALTEGPKATSVHGNTQIDLKGVGVTLAKPAADALNGVFKVTAFKEGLNIGTAKVNGLAK